MTMVQTTAEGLSLDDILRDLKRIVDAAIREGAGGNASYESVQRGLPDLALHVLTYIRFLENHRYLEYDRVSDQILVSERGHSAVADPEVWRDEAQNAFADQIADEGYGKADDTEQGTLGTLSDEVDNILDGIVGFDDDLQPEIDVEPLLEEDDDVTRVAGYDAQSAAEELEPAPQNDTTSTSSTGTAMSTNDTFASRRLSSGSSSSALSSSKSRPSSSVAAGGSSRQKLYERVDEIGCGGIGTVFLGKQIKLQRDVAIKEIKEIFDVFAGVQREDIVERFTGIVQTQASLLHPNIIQIVDLDTDAQFPYVVMQYAPNGNLRRLIDVEGRPPLQVALKYFLQILHALNTAHDNDVNHGGIKPENVVLDHAGNALLTDFGISGVADLDTNRNNNQVYVGVGTVAYMSPEQFRDPNTATVKSDIYSLGIMFYEMLTGKVPGRRSPMPSSFYPDIPRRLDDIFDRMSMDDQDERYDSIDEILTDIYESEEVMEILDKRGGFLFLRDPMTHGAAGLPGGGGGVAGAGGEPSAAELSEAHGDAEDEDEDLELPEAEGDVLDKLDKYGELFDEDDAEGQDEDTGANDDSEDED